MSDGLVKRLESVEGLESDGMMRRWNGGGGRRVVVRGGGEGSGVRGGKRGGGSGNMEWWLSH